MLFPGLTIVSDQACKNATNLFISYSLITTITWFLLGNMDCDILVILVLNSIGFCCSEIIVNGDFESELDGTNWLCNRCTLEREEDAFEGVYSGKITNRYNYYWFVSINYFTFLKRQSPYGFLYETQQHIRGHLDARGLIHMVCKMDMYYLIFQGKELGRDYPVHLSCGRRQL